jgi:hypothetical protein
MTNCASEMWWEIRDFVHAERAIVCACLLKLISKIKSVVCAPIFSLKVPLNFTNFSIFYKKKNKKNIPVPIYDETIQ